MTRGDVHKVEVRRAVTATDSVMLPRMEYDRAKTSARLLILWAGKCMSRVGLYLHVSKHLPSSHWLLMIGRIHKASGLISLIKIINEADRVVAAAGFVNHIYTTSSTRDIFHSFQVHEP